MNLISNFYSRQRFHDLVSKLEEIWSKSTQFYFCEHRLEFMKCFAKKSPFLSYQLAKIDPNNQ